jgi:tetratricopeptide (TPR) repeat protein
MVINELPRSNACTAGEFLDPVLAAAARKLKDAGREPEIAPLYRSVVEHGREEYLSKLAWALKKHGDVTEAKRTFERCVEAGIETVDVLINLGFIAENAGALAEATECYERAMAAGPPKEAATFLARMLAGSPRDAEVPALYRLAIRSNDANAAALLARRQWAAGEMDELADLYSSAIDWGRDDLRVEFACALHVLEPARDAPAIEAIRQALERGITVEDVRAAVRHQFVPQSAKIWVLEQLTAVSATFPPNHASDEADFRARLCVQLGLRLKEADDVDRARTAMQAAVALGYVPANGYLGELAEADGDTDEAIRRYDLASTGGVTWPLINLARLRERMDQPDEMLAVVRRILARVEPDEIGETGEEMRGRGDTSIALLFLREGLSAGGSQAAAALARISAS